MTRNVLGKRALAALLCGSLVLLSACGGGGGGGSLASGGIGGTGISKGPVTAYGSIVVNGVHFDINGATFRRDGVKTSAEPGIGEVVVVTGDFDSNGRTGTADEVRYRPLVVGPVTQPPDPATGTVEILGQTVQVDTRTVFDGITDLAALQPGDRIEVSGLIKANGEIQATLLRLDTGTGLQLQGTVHDLAPGRHTFMIGNQTVDYTTLSRQDIAELRNGDFVGVRSPHALTGSGVLDADHILARTRGITANAGDDVELAAFIERIDSVSRFVLSGITVQISAGTEFEGGTAADLATGARVEVEGTIDEHGVLVAEEIEFHPEGAIEMSAPLQQIACADTECHTGTLVLLDTPIRVDAHTVLEGDNDTSLDLAALQAGDWLDINAYQSPLAPGGNVTASHIETGDTATEVALTGHVESKNVTARQFTVLGVTIHTDHASFDDGDSTLFYATLNPGDIVEVTGTRSRAGEIDANTVERDD